MTKSLRSFQIRTRSFHNFDKWMELEGKELAWTETTFSFSLKLRLFLSFFSFFFRRNRGGFFHVIFDESQSVERTIRLGGKKFRNRRNGRVILQYFEIDDLGMYC